MFWNVITVIYPDYLFHRLVLEFVFNLLDLCHDSVCMLVYSFGGNFSFSSDRFVFSAVRMILML